MLHALYAACSDQGGPNSSMTLFILLTSLMNARVHTVQMAVSRSLRKSSPRYFIIL